MDRQAAAAAFRSQYRRRLGRDETARERADLHRAEQTATDQVGVRDLSTSGSTRWRARRTSWNCDGARLTWRTGRASRGFDCAATTELRRPRSPVRQRSVSCPQRSVKWGARSNVGQSLAHVHRQYGRRRRGSSPSLPGQVPHPGVPVGQHLMWGEPVRADPFSWLAAGLTTNTGVFHLGQPGTGKSAFAKRQMVEWPGGRASVVLGDPKGEYSELVRRMGGQVIRVGRGLDRINPLDSQAFAAADPMETRARRLTLVLALCGLVRKDRVVEQQGGGGAGRSHRRTVRARCRPDRAGCPAGAARSRRERDGCRGFAASSSTTASRRSCVGR